MSRVYFLLALYVVFQFSNGVFCKKSGKPDKSRRIGGADIKIKGNGGEMEIGRRGKGLSIRLGMLRQHNSTGYALENFNMSDVGYDIEASKNDTSLGVAATKIIIHAKNFVTNNDISLIWYVFRENGTVTGQDGNEYRVRKGTLKFNIEYNYQINPEVSYVELDILTRCKKGTKAHPKRDNIQIAKRGSNSKSNRSPFSNRICDSARVTYSPSYKVNGTKWVDMPEGFPKTQPMFRGWSSITLKFQPGNITYDPVAEVGDDIDQGYTDDNNSNSARQLSTATTFVIFGVIMLVKIVLV